MFKSMFRLVLIGAVLCLGLFLLAGNYYLVRTPDGYHMIKKENFHVKNVVVDTRDWKPLDWLENKEISKALTSKKLKEWGDQASKRWKAFSNDLEKMVDDFDFEKTSDSARQKVDKVKESARKKYDELVRKYEKGDLSMEKFQAKVDELAKWVRKEFEEIKRRMA